MARGVLKLVLRGEIRDCVLADLDDRYRRRRETGSAAGAWAWYWKQVLLAVFAVWKDGGPAPDRTQSPAGRALLRDTASSFVQDLVFAFRQIRRSPGFTAVAVTTLAIGTGATTAIFSVVNTVLLQPLPYPQSDRLVFAWVQTRDDATSIMSGPEVKEFREETTSFASVARMYGAGKMVFSAGDVPDRVNVQAVSFNLFATLRAPPLYGRDFTDADVHFLPVEVIRDPNAIRPTGALILSHEFWQRRFGGADVIGDLVQMNRQPHEIVGIQSPGFHSYLPAEFGEAAPVDVYYIPNWDQSQFPRDTRFIRVIARLRDGVTLAQAQAEVDAFAARQRERFPGQREDDYHLRLASLGEEVVAGSAGPIVLLFGAVGMVLLIAVVNVANLLLARGTTRASEVTIRASLGAGRSRLVRQWLTESLVIGLLGAGAGLLVARWGVSLVVQLGSEEIPRLNEASLSWPVLLFAIAVSLAAAVGFGIVPALRLSRPDLAGGLKDGARASTDRGGNAVRAGLVVVEVAMSLVLVVGAGLLLRSFANARNVDPGFVSSGVLTAQVVPTTRDAASEQDRLDLYRRLQQRLSDLPGVEAAGIVTPLPFDDIGGDAVAVERPNGEIQAVLVSTRRVFPGFFETVGVPLRAGRFFAWSDFTHLDRFTVVVDERFASRAWPGREAIGQRVQLTRREYGGANQVRDSTYWAEVIGVVGNVRSVRLTEDDDATVYYAFHQNMFGEATVVVRGPSDIASLTAAMRAEMEQISPHLPLSNFRLLEDYVTDSVAPIRFSLTVIGLFGLAGLLMAAVGLYGVIAFAVAQRTAEIGTRVALGASARDITRLVVGDGLRLTAIGLTVGLVVAGGLTRFLAAKLFGVTATDPITLAAVCAVLLAVALVASWVPARQAGRVDPVVTLRS